MKLDSNKPISQISNNKGDKILLSDKIYKIKNEENEVNEVIIHSPGIKSENEAVPSSDQIINNNPDKKKDIQLKVDEKKILEL